MWGDDSGHILIWTEQVDPSKIVELYHIAKVDATMTPRVQRKTYKSMILQFYTLLDIYLLAKCDVKCEPETIEVVHHDLS